jgi:LPXTG-motif cell wall-anchored protein
MMARVGKRRDGPGRQGLSKRFFVALLGLAGLGLGVWLFRSRRKKR